MPRPLAGVALVVALGACTPASPPDDELESRPGRAVVDVTAIDFGLVAVGTVADRVVTLRNEGDRPLTISGVRVDDSWAFGVAGLPSTLAPHARAVLRVTFAPTFAGIFRGRLVLATNTPAAPKLELAVTGSSDRRRLRPVPELLDFGTVAAGATRVRALRIQDDGDATSSPRQFLGARIVGRDAGAFALTHERLPAIPTGGRAGLDVVFVASGAGAREAELALQTDDPFARELVVPLRATSAVLESCVLSALAPTSTASVGPNREAALVAAVRNVGGSTCLLDATLAMAEGSFFRVVDPGGDDLLDGGQVRGFTLFFRAPAPGVYRDELVVTPSIGEPVRIPLEVTVELRGCLLIAPADLDFGLVTGCTGATRLVNVHNTCSWPVDVTSIALGPGTSPELHLTAPELPVSIPATESLSLRITYRPVEASATGSILLSAGDRASGPYLVTLRATNEGWLQVDGYDQPSMPKVDVLFVLDGSTSTAGTWPAREENFGRFFDRLVATSTDYHLAVTTMDVGAEAGRLVPLAAGQPRVVGMDTPNARATFISNANVGSTGSETESGFQAMRLALSEPLSTSHNAGFLRDDARLSVVFLSDEDDQSSGTVDEAREFLVAVKGPRRANLVTALAVAPGRYAELARAMGGVIADPLAADWVTAALGPWGGVPTHSRTVFFLSATPSGVVEVTVNGVFDATAWTYDPARNAVLFAQPPAPGARIEIRYFVGCGP